MNIKDYVDDWTIRFLRMNFIVIFVFILIDLLPFISWRYMTILPIIFLGALVRIAILWSREEAQSPNIEQVENYARIWTIGNVIMLTVIMGVAAFLPLSALREALRGVMLFYPFYLILALAVGYSMTKFIWPELIKLADKWEL